MGVFFLKQRRCSCAKSCINKQKGDCKKMSLPSAWVHRCTQTVKPEDIQYPMKKKTEGLGGAGGGRMAFLNPLQFSKLTMSWKMEQGLCKPFCYPSWKKRLYPSPFLLLGVLMCYNVLLQLPLVLDKGGGLYKSFCSAFINYGWDPVATDQI